MITKRKVKCTAKTYQNSGAASPTAAMLASTTATVSVQWGAAPQKFTISLTACQIEKVTPGDANGYQTFDLSLIIENNGMSIATDVTGA